MKLSPLFLLTFCAAFTAPLQGQCFDDQLRGSYGYLATLGVTSTTTTPEPGTDPVTPVTFSNAPVGRLLGGIAGTTGTSVGSTFFFDGFGRIFGGSNANTFIQNQASTEIGSYTVSSNCTVRVTLNDAFTTSNNTTTPQTASLIGLVARGGNEIYLAQLAPVATGATAPTGTAALTQRTAIRLIRFSDRFSTGCSLGTLRGSYGLIGQGTSTLSPTTGATTTPPTNPYFSPFIGRVSFDGTGNITTSPVAGTSLGTFQYRGTYTVNSDCTGTMSITQQPVPAAGSTTPVVSTAVNFLITPESAFVDSTGRVASQNVQDLKPGFIFSIANANQTMNGVGVPQ